MMKYGCNLKTMYRMSKLSKNMNLALKNTPHLKADSNTSCRQHLTNKMCNPDRCCQVRKTKSNREHREEFNIAASKDN